MNRLGQLLQLLLLVPQADHAIGRESSGELYPWVERHRYYFTSVSSKMKDVLSGSCLYNLQVISDSTIQLPIVNGSVYVASFPPKEEIVKWWRTFDRPMQMRVDPNLCDAVLTKRIPIFNNTGCQLQGYMNPSAPRCQNKYLKYICDKSRMPIDDPKSNGFILPESDHATAELPPFPWLLTVRNSFVSMCGHISSGCGLMHTTSNCMGIMLSYQANLFFEKCRTTLLDNVDLESKVHGTVGSCSPGAPYSDEFEYHDRVFVVAESDDTYVYHLHLEIMPRIIYHLDFLLKNPDIKILIGCDSKKSVSGTNFGLKHMLLSMRPLMDMAGLSMDRLVVHKHVFAREVYSPMEGGCQDPVYNTWQILTMRQHFMRTLNISDTDSDTPFGASSDGVLSDRQVAMKSNNVKNIPHRVLNAPSKPVMLLMKRSTGAKHTRNAGDLVRQWSTAFTERILNALKSQFPEYEVKLFSDTDEKLMRCHACQIRAFAEADVLIGMHGAGLSNQLYMKPNSAVVELCPYQNDGRCLLGGGPFSRTAAVMSHNYMIHQPPHGEYKWITKGMTSEFNVDRFVVHIHSYLQSLKAEV